MNIISDQALALLKDENFQQGIWLGRMIVAIAGLATGGSETIGSVLAKQGFLPGQCTPEDTNIALGAVAAFHSLGVIVTLPERQ